MKETRFPSGVTYDFTIPIIMANSLGYENLPEALAVTARRVAKEREHVSWIEALTGGGEEGESLEIRFHRCCGFKFFSSTYYIRKKGSGEIYLFEK